MKIDVAAIAVLAGLLTPALNAQVIDWGKLNKAAADMPAPRLVSAATPAEIAKDAAAVAAKQKALVELFADAFRHAKFAMLAIKEGRSIGIDGTKIYIYTCKGYENYDYYGADKDVSQTEFAVLETGDGKTLVYRPLVGAARTTKALKNGMAIVTDDDKETALKNAKAIVYDELVRKALEEMSAKPGAAALNASHQTASVDAAAKEAALTEFLTGMIRGSKFAMAAINDGKSVAIWDSRVYIYTCHGYDNYESYADADVRQAPFGILDMGDKKMLVYVPLIGAARTYDALEKSGAIVTDGDEGRALKKAKAVAYAELTKKALDVIAQNPNLPLSVSR